MTLSRREGSMEKGAEAVQCCYLYAHFSKGKNSGKFEILADRRDLIAIICCHNSSFSVEFVPATHIKKLSSILE